MIINDTTPSNGFTRCEICNLQTPVRFGGKCEGHAADFYVETRDQLTAKLEELDKLTGHLDNALAIVEDYLDALRETAGLELSGKAREAARELAHAGLIELPTKRFTVTYTIGTQYDVQIDAIDEADAERIFEELYEEHYGDLPDAEENEILHTVDRVEINAFN